MKTDRQQLFETASIPKAYFTLTIPSVLGKVIMLLYNMADTWFIAATGDTNLVAGVALCGPAFTLMLAIGDMFGMGGSSVISRLFGKGEIDRARRVSVFCFYGAMLGGFLTSIVLLTFQTPILTLLGADSGTMAYAKQYYFWMALGAPLMITPIVPLNLLRSEGMAKASMLGSSLGSVANMILDPIFIFSFGMGAAGAAIATVLSNGISLLVYLYFIKRKAQILSVSPKFLAGKKGEIMPVFSIGIPASANQLMNTFGQIVSNRFLLLYGSTVLAAAGISSKISRIPSMMIVGFAFSAGPLVGYNYGQGNTERVKKVIRFFYSFQVLVSSAVALVLMILAPQLVRGFMEDATIVSVGTEYLRWHLVNIPFMAVFMVSSCLMQATGNAKGATILSLGRQGVVFICVIILANALFGYNGVIAAQAVTDLISAGIAAFLVRKQIWKKLDTQKAL